MLVGTQYYRPPFPNQRYWEDDFRRIKDCGLNTVQLWVVWAWVESKPGEFRFEDYDRLVELADKNGLGLVLSTIAEIHPYWIHKEVPGSEMVDSQGTKVISSNRGEIHFGLTPGGCFDHPGVWERMARFLGETVSRYRGASCLRGWDAWNEIRWNVQADGPVCYCDHTLRAFRGWLQESHGSLDALNAAWRRRYGNWEEILPGKAHTRPFTEMMAFLRFLTARTNAHAKARYDVMKPLDSSHPVTVHGAFPCATWGGAPDNQVLNRGNDWNFADDLDGVGCSSFPLWQGIDDADFGLRVEMVKSAGRDKQVWLSEVQGGRASSGFDVHTPVPANAQQRWTWNGLAGGADAVLFWCWRDEVFGTESGGFGISGADGLAEERLAAMRRTADILAAHQGLFAEYKPTASRVGVLFSPESFYLNWALEGHANRSVESLMGYCRALVRQSISFTLVEEAHLEVLDQVDILFAPRLAVADRPLEEALIAFVQRGGVLLTESECGAYDTAGIYRYPEDRFLTRLTGLQEIGRRALTSSALKVNLADTVLDMAITQWLTPYEKGPGEVMAAGDEGAIIQSVTVGAGKVILCGTYLGDAYRRQWSKGFEQFVSELVHRAGCAPSYRMLTPAPSEEAFVYVKQGASDGKQVFFVFAPHGCREAAIAFNESLLKGQAFHDLQTSAVTPLTLESGMLVWRGNIGEAGLAVLVEA